LDLKERLLEDMKKAMKARESGRERLSLIRMLRAAIKNAEIEKGCDLDDPGVVEVLAGELKKRKDALEEFRKAGRDDLVKATEKELEILAEYLPEPLGEEEIRQMVIALVEEMGATGPKDLGRVMGRVMPQVRGRADGRVVNRVVREVLAGE